MEIKQRKGISLIVLVITIIVMIVLATAIILSLQSSGIIGRANEAKSKNDIASAKELVAVANGEWLLMTEAEQKSNGGSFVAYAESKLQSAGHNLGELVVSESGTVEKCVATIGTNKFDKLSAAVNFVSDESEEETKITIVSDIVLEETVIVDKYKWILLDLNGHSITAKEGVHPITNKAYLTITDSSNEKTGCIRGISDKERYEEKYDLNKDGVVGQFDIKLIEVVYGKQEGEEGWETVKHYNFNGDKILDFIDMAWIVNRSNETYGIYNDGNYAELIIDGIAKDKIIGEPVGIYNKNGTVEGWE